MLKVGRNNRSDKTQSHSEIEAILLVDLTKKIVVKVTSTRSITVSSNYDQHCTDFLFRSRCTKRLT